MNKAENIRGRVDVCRMGNAFTTGDAAGLATKDMAEGIGPAVKSGLMAADTIVDGPTYDLGMIERKSFDAKQLLPRIRRNSQRFTIPPL